MINFETSQGDGIVYVFSNPAMPGIVKIGRTTRASVDVRLKELFTTGVPVPFECDYACLVGSCVDVESALHAAFEPYKINPRREFFKIEAGQAIAILKVLAIEEITESVSEEVERELDPVDVSAGKRLKISRRPPLDFYQMGIPNGGVLQWHDDTSRIVTVCGNKQVKYLDAEMSLTRVTSDILAKGYTVQPTPYWTYEGRTLSEIYDETYPKEEE